MVDLQQPESDDYWDEVLLRWQPSLAHRLWRAHSDAVNAGLLRRWLAPGQGSILKTDLFDEAVGRGLYPELTARSEEVVGIDVAAAAVRAATQRYPQLRGQVGRVEALGFPAARFDAVFSNSTLDHFDSRGTLAAAVGELARVLRPGGRLIITLDNRANPIIALRTSMLAGLFRRARAVPYFVGATLGPLGLARCLRANGFTVLDQASIMHCPPQIAAELAARHGDPPDADRVEPHLRRVLAFERMGRWPSHAVTAHFTAALAVKQGAPPRAAARS